MVVSSCITLHNVYFCGPWSDGSVGGEGYDSHVALVTLILFVINILIVRVVM
jgi:hypothetical protein